jgi:hypothetical protein
MDERKKYDKWLSKGGELAFRVLGEVDFEFLC